MLDDLHGKLEPAEQKYRLAAFREAHAYVATAAQGGGVHVIEREVSKSFPRKPRPDGRRVDIVVHKGSAFVPDRPSFSIN
jgi:hypothetical protein